MSGSQAQVRRLKTSPAAWCEVVIRVRDLDTDETSVETHELWAPADDQRQRTQLIDIVQRLRPGARVKSFAGRVASFVDGKHLVVARYGELVPPPPGEADPAASGEQQPLFGDVA